MNSCDLLFLCRDNIAYLLTRMEFKLSKIIERNEISCLRDLTVGEDKAIKYKKHYHALPVSEGQCEGLTMTFSQISVVKDLRNIFEKLNLETVSIAKTDFINNVIIE